MKPGFTLIELALALAVAALVLAALAAGLVGSLRAERQVRALIAPDAEEAAVLAQLHDDLLSAVRPVGTVVAPFRLSQPATGADGVLSFLACGPVPLHPALAARAATAGQAVVAWTVRGTDDGLAWIRSVDPHVLAAGTPPAPGEETMLDGLAEVAVEVLADGLWSATYDSDTRLGALPVAVRVAWRRRAADGAAGPKRQIVIELPQVALDPLQTAPVPTGAVP